MSELPESIAVLDVGAGEHPHPDATATLDIREDIAVDYPGVDISIDDWPVPDESVQHAICSHVLEHVPPQRVGHVFRELDRVLVPGGFARIELPHAGTWAAGTDLTHQGTGGTTPDVDRYFGSDPGDLEQYWPDLDWSVHAHARVEFPTFVRPSLRVSRRISDGSTSMSLARTPFVQVGPVIVQVRKRADGGEEQ